MDNLAVHKLIKYALEMQKLEQDGLLLRLPCKVGDVIYLVDFGENAYDEATVQSIETDTKDNRILLNSDYEIGTCLDDDYVFLTREEAEQALAERKGGVRDEY